MPEVERILGTPRGDHVPPRAAAAEMIEGEKLAGEVEWLAVGRRSGGHEPDVARHRRERCEQRDRLELGAVALSHQRAGRIVAAADRELVGHEHEVEFAAFGRLRNAQEVAKIHRSIGWDVRMAPGGDVVAHAEHRKPKFDLCHDNVPQPLDPRMRVRYKGSNDEPIIGCSPVREIVQSALNLSAIVNLQSEQVNFEPSRGGLGRIKIADVWCFSMQQKTDTFDWWRDQPKHL